MVFRGENKCITIMPSQLRRHWHLEFGGRITGLSEYIFEEVILEFGTSRAAGSDTAFSPSATEKGETLV